MLQAYLILVSERWFLRDVAQREQPLLDASAADRSGSVFLEELVHLVRVLGEFGQIHRNRTSLSQEITRPGLRASREFSLQTLGWLPRVELYNARAIIQMSIKICA